MQIADLNFSQCRKSQNLTTFVYIKYNVFRPFKEIASKKCLHRITASENNLLCIYYTCLVHVFISLITPETVLVNVVYLTDIDTK